MLDSDDTIVAIATPLGVGGLGVIRLSGSKALPIVSSLIKKSSFSLKDVASHTLHHCTLEQEGRLLDDVVIAVFRNPRSYTGEDVVEISCHGSPAVLKDIVMACEHKGARLARPGEFTQRSFVNGKRDLIQAEAVADLIHARSSGAALLATQQLQGVLSQQLRQLRDHLLSVLAHVEANLDFVEEDIPAFHHQQLHDELLVVERELNQLIETGVRGRWVRDGLRVVLTGRPNVGKSSLFNALLANDRAIVTDLPGTTRDTLEEALDWKGWPVILTDTAGVREAADVAEAKGLDRTRQAQQIADVIFFVVDGSQRLKDEDEAMAHQLPREKTWVILNKSDKGTALSPKDFQRWNFQGVMPVSALKAQGMDELQRVVVAHFSSTEKKATSTGSPVISNLRHLAHLEKAAMFVTRAKEALVTKKTEESFSMDLREALNELGAITGETVTEDLLSKIFATFCIGK